MPCFRSPISPSDALPLTSSVPDDKWLYMDVYSDLIEFYMIIIIIIIQMNVFVRELCTELMNGVGR